MLTMTDNAAEAVRQISANSGLEPDPGLRISVGEPTPEGTPLESGLAGAALERPDDRGGRRPVYLEQPAAEALGDKVLDAQLEGEQVRFALRDAAPGSVDGNTPGV